MTPQELNDIQRILGLTNVRLYRTLGVTEATLCNWKAGRIAVPNPAALALRMLVHYRRDSSLWIK